MLEGGMTHTFHPNNSLRNRATTEVFPGSLAFSATNQFGNLNDFALTPEIFAQIVEECRVERLNRWHPSRIVIVQDRLNLNFVLPAFAHSDSTGISNLLFRNVETDSLLFPNRIDRNNRVFSHIPPAVYDVILLFNSGNYLQMDSIEFRQFAYTELNLRRLPIIPADSLSKQWLLLNTGNVPIGGASGNQVTTRGTPPQGRTVTLTNRVAGRNQVTGTVLDEIGEPLIGATVMIRGTQQGTIANIDGEFTLSMDEYQATLVFSFIGYRTQEVQVTAGSHIVVRMDADQALLSEVVVTAMGVSRERSRMSFAVASVTSTDAQGQIPEEELRDDAEETAEAEAQLHAQLMQMSGLRTNFSNVAFWEPRLVSDRRGQARFTVTFPDNITQWNAVVYAMNRRLQTGTARRYIRSYKPIMAELRHPQFLVVGDSAFYSGIIRNYTQDRGIEGMVSFTIGQDTILNEAVRFDTSHNNRILVSPSTTDSITTTYIFRRNDGFFDGEKRTIPVFPLGTEVSDGTLEFLRTGSRKIITAETDEEVHITLTARQIDVYMRASAFLMNYRHACNEQLASILMGLLNYRLYQEFAGNTFRYDRRINEIIRRLVGNQNQDRLWSWFGNQSRTSFWMSAHILRALNQAREAGFTVDLDLTRIEQDFIDTRQFRRITIRDIGILHALSEAGTEQNYEPALDYFDALIARHEFVADSIARYHNRPNMASYLKQRLQILEIRQRQGIGFSPEMLEPYLRTDIFGGVYVDDGRAVGRRWYENSLITTLIGYRIVRNDSTLQHLKAPMQMYILGTKRRGWNTFQASSAVATILPDLLAESASRDALATVVLSGKENRTLTEFPFRTVLTAGEQLTIEQTAGVPLIFTTYQLRRVTAEHQSEAFAIHTSLATDTVQAGVPVTMQVTVRAKQRNAEYVLIEVPIPAGFSYASRQQSRRHGEVHREHFKDRVIIYVDRMPMGEYTFYIQLLPRFTGSFALNPAKVELMYFPVIRSNNELRRVVIFE